MCGIAGIFSLDDHIIKNAQNRIWRMTRMLEHRGPDNQDVYISPDGLLALGNTRLSIVDPLCLLKQPLEATDGQAVLSFNGEVYNYMELKRELEGRGVAFRSRMDTEVLLEGIRLEGEGFLNRLDGMWAFAYYDVPKQRLLLSRDLMGERHLFYRIDKENDELIFASEVKPILADGGRVFNVDLEALITSLRFYSAPPGRTPIKEIERMLPGHNITVSSGNINNYRYLKLHPEKWFDYFKKRPSLDDLLDTFEEKFHHLCKRRLPLDVPFISTLSGGIDSTLICAFASDLGKRKINTLYGESALSPKQRGEDMDEYAASMFTSEKFNTNHIYTKMNSVDSVPVLNRLSENGFDGMIDAGCASFEMLGHAVRQQSLKVILISDGPDETLGGYGVDQRAYFMDRIFERTPYAYNSLRMLSFTKVAPLIMSRMGQRDTMWMKTPLAKYIVPPFTSYEPFRFEPMHQSIGAATLMKLFPEKEVLATTRHYGLIDEAYKDILPGFDDYTQMRALSYASNSLPNHFNYRTDKAFLRVSVECRLPWQAPDMVEFMIAMPAYLRFGEGSSTKFLMRRVAERRIGREIAWRNKYGFSRPLYNTPEVREKMHFEDIIRSSSLFDDLPFKKGARELMLKPKYKKLLWPFFVLSKTYERFKRGAYE